MKYTIRKLAKISGTSVRTLDWYDKKGLLKPAYFGANNYRYYEKEQLLKLQQILFFCELGFSLNDIQKLLCQNDLNQINALIAHRKILREDIERKKSLISTIDKTIYPLKNDVLNADALYPDLEHASEEYDECMVKSQVSSNGKLSIKSKKTDKKLNKESYLDEDMIYTALALAIEDNKEPESSEVQAIIDLHYQMVKRYYYPSKEHYVALINLYARSPNFEKFFAKYHSDMIEFISKAIIFYADKNL